MTDMLYLSIRSNWVIVSMLYISYMFVFLIVLLRLISIIV